MRKYIKLFGCGIILIFITLFGIINPVGLNNRESSNLPPKGSAFDGLLTEVIYREVCLDPTSTTDNDGLYPFEIFKSVITGSTDNSISYIFYEGNSSTNYQWQVNAIGTEYYNYSDMIIGANSETGNQVHFVLHTNITDFNTYYTAHITDINYNIGKWGLTGTTISFVTDVPKGTHRMTIQGTNAAGIYNITAVWNASKGLLLHLFRGNSTANSTMECVYYNGMLTSNIFGFLPGQMIRYAEMDLNKDENQFIFIRDQFAYIYYNPELNRYRLLVNRTGFNDVSETSKNYSKPYRLYGDVNPDDWNTTMAQYDKYFPKDMMLDMNRVKTSMLATLPAQGFSNLNIITGEMWYEATGNYPDGKPFYWFIQGLPNSGAMQLQLLKDMDTSGNIISHKATFAIEGPGVKTSASWLGVTIGDEWTIVHQREENGHESNSMGESSWNRDEFNYMQIKVTHIFGLNKTTMAVCGDIFHWHTDGETRIKEKEFEPLIIYNPESPFSFIDLAGWAGDHHEGGPSLLIPKTTNMNDAGNQTALISKLNVLNKMQFNRTHFEARSGSMIFQERTSNAYKEEYMNFEFTIDGILAHYENRRQIHNNSGTYNRDEYSRDTGILLNTTKTCSKANVAEMTDTKAGQTYIWSHSKYSKDDSKSDPSAKYKNKVEVLAVLSACENYLVFIGKRYNKEPNATEFKSRDWNASGTMLNMWILGSIQKDNVWSWVMQDAMFFDKSVDLTADSTKSDFAEIVNFMFGTSISTANVDATKLTISAKITEGDITKSIRIALNTNGTLQDMLMGETKSEDWNNWERTVLVTAPLGMTVGEVFENPDNYVPEDLENMPDFAVDGYSLNFLLIFAILGITWIIVKRRHH